MYINVYVLSLQQDNSVLRVQEPKIVKLLAVKALLLLPSLLLLLWTQRER